MYVFSYSTTLFIYSIDVYPINIFYPLEVSLLSDRNDDSALRDDGPSSPPPGGESSSSPRGDGSSSPPREAGPTYPSRGVSSSVAPPQPALRP